MQDSSRQISVSVCIPAFNEEAVIADAVAEAVEVLEALPGDHEILVVNDGSADRTGEILSELSRQVPMLRVLEHEKNLGNPAAQKTLVGAARGRFIFHIGADREWRMDEIPRMLAKLEEGYDIVIGVRRKKQYPLARKVVSEGFNLLVALLWGKHFGDLGSLKMARASLWTRLPFESNSAFLHAERVLVAYRNGARIATVPVDHAARKTGKSAYTSPAQPLRALADLLRFRFSPRSRYHMTEDWREH